jgi:hypothetical protein
MARKDHLISQKEFRFLVSFCVVLLFLIVSLLLLPSSSTASAGGNDNFTTPPPQRDGHAPLFIDYPEDGAIFPPGITPPTFIWRDKSATSWHITISLGDGFPAIHSVSAGQRMQIGPIDPQCISSTNQLPALTPAQAASWTWTPDPAIWSAIQLHSTLKPAILTISGFRDGRILTSESHISFSTSTDKVDAPIFYRDVALMPAANIDGTVQPLAPSAVHLIQWRLRDIRENESRVVLKDVPTCVNCHSLARDGKTMGIDVDGPNND